MAMSPQHHQHQLQQQQQQQKDGGASTTREKDKSSSSSSSSSKSSTARPNILEARAEQNKKDLPLNVKMMLQKRPEMWADPQFAVRRYMGRHLRHDGSAIAFVWLDFVPRGASRRS
jgi:hypothetical protein